MILPNRKPYVCWKKEGKACMVEKPHSDGLCGKSVVVINNSSEYISPGDGTCPARFHSGCWSLLVDPLMGWCKHTRLAGEVALEFRTYVGFPPYRGKASVYAHKRKHVFNGSSKSMFLLLVSNLWSLVSVAMSFIARNVIYCATPCFLWRILPRPQPRCSLSPLHLSSHAPPLPCSVSSNL